MVTGAKTVVVDTVSGAFAIVGILVCKVVAVRHHHVPLRVLELDAVVGIPTGAEAIVGQGAVHVLVGVARGSGHTVEVAGIGQIGVESWGEDFAEFGPHRGRSRC